MSLSHEIKRQKEICAQATEGPWVLVEEDRLGDYWNVQGPKKDGFGFLTGPEANFAIEARTMWPRCLEALEFCQKIIAEEWGDDSSVYQNFERILKGESEQRSDSE